MYNVSGFALPPIKTDRHHTTEKKNVEYGETFQTDKHTKAAICQKLFFSQQFLGEWLLVVCVHNRLRHKYQTLSIRVFQTEFMEKKGR
jgi:hypothetical protein